MSDYDEAWQDYKRRRNLFMFALLGYVPIVFAFAYSSVKFLGSAAPGLTLAIAWTLFFVVAAARVQMFRCPRCAELFFVKGMYHNIFAGKCLQCGLAKYAEGRGDRRT